jgi:hypothetical protein
MFGHSGNCPCDRTAEGQDPDRRTILGGGLGLGALGILIDAVLTDNEAMADAKPTPDARVSDRAGAHPHKDVRPVPMRPRVYTRKEWGAKHTKKATKVVARKPDHIVVHHTATPNTTDYSLAHAYKLSRDIQRFHMRHRGWNDTGQQLTISRGGHVMEGRDKSLAAILSGRHAIGAQALHHNDHTIGIENEGNYMKAPVPAALWSSLITVCTWLCFEYRLDPYRAIVGHRDYGHTDCPGDVLYARLPELRTSVAARLPRRTATKSRSAGAPATSPSATPDPGSAVEEPSPDAGYDPDEAPTVESPPSSTVEPTRTPKVSDVFPTYRERSP